MKNTVLLKGNRYGLVLSVREDTDFSDILDALRLQLETMVSKGTVKFFKESDSAISFQGKSFSDEEQRQMIELIQTITGMNIILVIDEDKERELLFHSSLKEHLMRLSNHDGLFCRGDLKSGQTLECKKSVVLIGNVEKGSRVISTGNIVILGKLSGTACAGISGNEKTTITARHMNPEKLRIGDVVGKPKKNRQIQGPVIAYIEKDSIYLESVFS